MADQVQVITAKFNVDDGPLQKLLKTLELGGKDAEELTAALEKAGVSMDELGKAAEKATKTGTDGFKSLKQQLKEARNDATLLAQKFGENSKQALDAAKRVAQLTEEIDDFNQRVKALNPEAKFNAVQQSLQGVLGGLQGVTGALQLFGAESEEVQKIATKLQGALNLAQGINSVIGLKDAFGNLRAALGITAAAQTTLTAANEAEAASATTAAAANRTLLASLGPIVLVVGAIAAAYYLWQSAQEEVAVDIDKLIDQFEELRKNQELQLNLTKEQGASEVELLTIRQDNNKLYQQQLTAIAAQAKEEAKRNDIGKQINDLKREEQLLAVQLEKAIRNATVAELQRQQAIRERAAASAAGLKAQFDAEIAAQLAKIDKQTALNKKVNDVLAKDNADKIAGDNVAEQDGLQQKIDLLKSYGIDVQDLEAELALYKKNLRKNELKEFEENEQRKRDIAVGLAQQSFDFILTLSNNAAQARRFELQKEKDQGIITEQQYQEKLKVIEREAARRQKELAIFSATVAFAEALVKALTTKNPPAALILAAAVGGLNLAKIIATPIPKFKEGTLNFQGGNMDSDGGRLAMLHPGEAVIPQDRNRMYAPAIRAIFNKQISPREINAFVQNKLNGKIESRVTADVDTYGLARAMSRNKGVQIENARVVGKAIASEIANRINRRQMI